MTVLAVEIGARIQSIRKANGWSQTELAEKVGATATAVCYWESGRTEIPLSRLFAVAEAFLIKPAWLLSGRDEHPYVTLNPAMKSGQPVVQHTRLRVEAVIGLLVAGETVAAVMADYDITRADVLCCAWYVGQYGMPGYPRWRKLLRDWSKMAGNLMWSAGECDYDAIPDPPIGDDSERKPK